MTSLAPSVEAASSAVESADDTGGDVFTQLGLRAELLQVLEELQYTTPTPIQAGIIPHIVAGHDVIGQAQTGTGKTAAFALPLLNNLDVDNRDVQVLVLTPTRELAGQVAEACQRYGKGLRGLRLAALYGGAGYGDQLRALKRGAQVVIGTPGRVMDHIERGTLDVSKLQCLVLDEADEMLRMGFIGDVEWVLERLPEQRQLALFSATMPPEIHRIATRYLQNPSEVRIAAKTATASTVRQRIWFVRGMGKVDALSRLVEGEADVDGVLVFVRTKQATVEVVEELRARGMTAAALNGDMPQSLRERVVAQLKAGELDLVVATDVAARGLDVQRISHVINYDMPMDSETYVHRIGRTGRAGRTGEAILFVHPRERRAAQRLQKQTRHNMEELKLPNAAAINKIRTQRFAAKAQAALEHKDLAHCEELVATLVAEHEMEPLRLATALVRMLHAERPVFVSDEQLARPRKQNNKRQREPAQYGDGPTTDYYKLHVGRKHGVRVNMIVGAIANELGLAGHQINEIRLHDNHTTLSLPPELSGRDRASLAGIRVAGRAFNAERLSGQPREEPRRRFDKRPGDRRSQGRREGRREGFRKRRPRD